MAKTLTWAELGKLAERKKLVLECFVVAGLYRAWLHGGPWTAIRPDGWCLDVMKPSEGSARRALCRAITAIRSAK